MEVKEIINLWEQIKQSLDLKGKYIRFKEHDDSRQDKHMKVDWCKVLFSDRSDNEIKYTIHGVMLDPYESANFQFSLSTCESTLHFSLQDLLENKSAVKDIEEVTEEDFMTLLDYKVQCFKECVIYNE